MRYWLLFIVLATGCCGQYKSDEEILSNMVSPVKIIGKSCEDNGFGAHHFVTVIDSTGQVATFYNGLGTTLCSKNINDTIK